MPRLALALCLLWFGSLFVFRTVVQWRKTGSTGIKGFHGRIGSLPWMAGVSVSLGLAAASVAPFAAIFGWKGGTLLFAHDAVHVSGAALALIGIGGGLMAQLAMGESWRVGVDESEETKLVTTGLFAWVRNPIFSFVGLSLLGLVLLVPNPLALVAGLLCTLGIELQVRAVEEPYLMKTHGETYQAYCERVGRFLPRIGRLGGLPDHRAG